MTPRHEMSVWILRLLSQTIRDIEHPDPGETELAAVFDALADQWGVGEMTPLVMAVTKFAAEFARDCGLTGSNLADALAAAEPSRSPFTDKEHQE